MLLLLLRADIPDGRGAGDPARGLRAGQVQRPGDAPAGLLQGLHHLGRTAPPPTSQALIR
jgi:hypothetical protein